MLKPHGLWSPLLSSQDVSVSDQLLEYASIQNILVYWPTYRQKCFQKLPKEKVSSTLGLVRYHHLHFGDEITARDHRMNKR